MTLSVSEKGQVTIPMRLRDRLGLRAGQVLDFEEDHGTLGARKADRQDPVDRAYGILNLDVTPDTFVDLIRGAVDMP